MLNAKIGCANHNGKVCDDFSFVFNWPNRPTGHLADVHREGLFKVCVDGGRSPNFDLFCMLQYEFENQILFELGST